MPPADNQKNLALGALAAAIGMASGNASAATYTVTSNDPVGPNSLGLAMALANANEGPDTINIETTGTIDLLGIQMAPLDGDGLTINGPGMSDLTIVGTSGEGAVFRAYGGGAFSLSGMTITGANRGVLRGSGALVTIDDVSISGNVHTTDLIRLYGGGALTITDSVLDENTSTASNKVIDSYNVVNVTISDTSISGNTSDNDIVQFGRTGEAVYLDGVMINDNTSTEGSAVRSYDSNLVILSSQISGNTGDDRGAAVNARYGSVDIRDSSLSDNASSSRGGAIYARYSPLDIRGSVFSGNSGYSGGAIQASAYSGEISIESSSFVGNSATSYEGTGGALNISFGGFSGGSVSIEGSLIKDNQSAGSDGAISVQTGQLTITDSVISGNSARFGAGAADINMSYEGTGTISGTVVDANTSVYGAGGLDIDTGSYGDFTIVDSTISDNITTQGEGTASGLTVDLEGYWGGASLTLRNSTISGNSGPFEAVEIDDFSGDYYSNTLNIFNSTFSGNTSTTQRAPVFIDEVTSVNIQHSTFVNNQGAGVDTTQVHIAPSRTYYGSTTQATLTNVVFSSSNDYEVITNGDNLSNAGGFTGGTYGLTVSLEGVVMTNGLLDYGDADTNLIGVPLEADPQLGPLKDNGGRTLTHAPASADSYVVDLGEGQARPNGEDQRGVAPAAGDLNADLGAVEYLDPAVNTAPRLVANIGKQLAGRVGREIPGITVADAFTDAEGDTISVDSVVGLPGGLSFDGTDISGELAVAGDFVVTVTVSDDGSPSLSTTKQFNVRISEAKSGLSNAEIAALLDDDDGGTVPLTFLSTLAAMAWLRRRRQ